MILSRRTFIQRGALCAGVLIGGSLLTGYGATLSGCTFSKGNLRAVTDMGGREVFVPEQITKLFCSNPIGTVDLYTLAPEMLIGWNFRPSGDNKKYIPDEYFGLPSLGVWMGAGAVPNSEEIAEQDPSLIFCYWTNDDVGREMADQIRDETGFPVVLVDYDLRSAPGMYRYVSSLIGKAERGEELASYCEHALERIRGIVSRVPESRRKSVFLAQGIDGLTTDPVGSMHVTDALELIGTNNVADLPGTEGKGMGMPSVNLEQIITWDPDAVLVAEYSMSDTESSDTYGAIKQDRDWQNVSCVAAGELYRIPQSPFSWFGRPPSVARLLGCLWLLRILYPDYASEIDMRQETIDFYRLFYDVDLDDDTLEAILDSTGIEQQD